MCTSGGPDEDLESLLNPATIHRNEEQGSLSFVSRFHINFHTSLKVGLLIISQHQMAKIVFKLNTVDKQYCILCRECVAGDDAKVKNSIS